MVISATKQRYTWLGAGTPTRRACAFTLIEVMIAIAILGIGAILVASMFTVSISMSRTTQDETNAAQIARNAFAVLSTTMTDQNTPQHGDNLRPVNSSPELWEAISGSVINNVDPRYAWVALYQRSPQNRYAKVVMIVARVRNRSLYSPLDAAEDPNDTTGRGCSLEARPVDVKITQSPDGQGSLATFDTTSPNYTAVAEESFVVVAGSEGDVSNAVGRVYRIGNPKDVSRGEWYISPGYELQNAADQINADTTCFLLGRGFRDLRKPAAGFEGPAQDLAVFTSWVYLR